MLPFVPAAAEYASMLSTVTMLRRCFKVQRRRMGLKGLRLGFGWYSDLNILSLRALVSM